MKKSDSIVELAKALALAQAEVPVVRMNRTNPFFSSRYADLGAVIEAYKPVFHKHGLSITLFPTGSNGEVGLTSLLVHTSGEWLEDTILLPLDKPEELDDSPEEEYSGKRKKKSKGLPVSQKAGIIFSYLRRYAISSITGLYADEDTDGNESSNSTFVRSEVASMVKAVIDSGDKSKIAGYREVLKRYDPNADANAIRGEDLTKVLEELKSLEKGEK